MVRSLLSRLGIGSERGQPPRPPPPPKRISVKRPPPEEVAPERASAATLPPPACRFLESLVRIPDSLDLHALPPDDRLFLSEIMKKLRDNKIEVPVLPNTAIEVSRLLASPNSNLADFVKALETDPALSVGILRIANSAFYGLTTPTNSLRDAVFRIGLSQLRTIVILSHMQDKVLQSGLFEREVGWLSDLSLALAHLGQSLARELDLEPSVAFTRGVLSHLEHFLIMGTLAEVARQHRVKTHPSEECLHEAFFRFGSKIRELAARLWELEELLAGDGQEDEIVSRYAQLRTALVAEWTGADLPQEVLGVSKLKLFEALAKLSPSA